MPTPRNVTKVQLFVDFINFYWHFVQDFSNVTKSLHQLTKKGEMWRWTEYQQNTFEELGVDLYPKHTPATTMVTRATSHVSV